MRLLWPAILLTAGCLLACDNSAVAAGTPNTTVSNAYSIPGVVWVALDDVNTHTLMVTSSIESPSESPASNLPSAFFGGAIVDSMVADLPGILAPVPPAVEVPNPTAAGLIAALILLATAIGNEVAQEGEDAKVERKPNYALVFTDLEGHDLTANPSYGKGCRDHVRDQAYPTARLGSTVKCYVIPSEDGPPELAIWGGDKRDRMLVDLPCGPLCLSKRSFYLRDGNDAIIASQSSDRIEGMKGNDLVFGRTGDDDIIGCHENDFYTDQTGLNGVFQKRSFEYPDNDVLHGGGGQDVIYGCAGNDVIDGEGGNDNRVAAPFGDIAAHPEEAAALHGGGGDDVVIGGDGNDHMEGGEDRDTILAREADFLGTDQVDELGDCGPNNLRPVGGNEYFRYSPGDVIRPSCTEEISMAINWIGTIDGWDRTELWPWYQ